MKKMLAFAMALAMSVTVLAGCGGGNTGNGGSSAGGRTPEELTELYSSAVNDNGGEMVEYNPAFTEVKEDDGSAMILENMGLTTGDMQAFAISSSMMNIKAYGIAAIMPAEGKADTVKEALQAYIDRTKSSFEKYLADQYEVAKNAKLETLEDGTILLVMCDGQDEVFEAISSDILAK